MNSKTENIHFKLLLLFPVFTLFQSFSFLSWINKALLVVVIILQLLIQFHHLKIKRKWFLLLSILVIVHIYAFFQTHFPLYNSNMLFYFAFWVLLVLYFVDFPDKICYALKHNLIYIKGIIQIWSIIVGVSIFMPSSYVIHKAWGSGRYFVSITGDAFRLAPACLMITTLVLVMYCFTRRKSYLWYLLIPMYSFLMCGSRTYLGIGLLVMIVFWYLYCEKKIHFYFSLIPLGLLVGYLILNSAAGAKILSTSYTGNSILDKWGTITNGRTIFWELDIRYFLKENIVNRLLGCGFNFDYVITAKYYTSAHWAHNDFISVLLNFGYVGLGMYLLSMWLLFKRYILRIRMPKLVIVVLFAVWFVNAMFNMFYTYTCSMISYPILLVAIRYFYLHKMEIVDEY